MGRVPETRGARIARKALLARKERIAALAARLRRGEDELQAVRRPDQLDRAADLEEHEVLEALQTAEAGDLAEVEAALKRISMGTYGKCERCSGPIGELRLRAVPQARFCMGCVAVR